MVYLSHSQRGLSTTRISPDNTSEVRCLVCVSSTSSSIGSLFTDGTKEI